jgi:hypothetical protein
MVTKEEIMQEIDTLTDAALENVQQFILFQQYVLNGKKSKTQLLLEKIERGEYVSDDEYLSSIPGMMESLQAASDEPIENCIPIEELWPDV